MHEAQPRPYASTYRQRCRSTHLVRAALPVGWRAHVVAERHGVIGANILLATEHVDPAEAVVSLGSTPLRWARASLRHRHAPSPTNSNRISQYGLFCMVHTGSAQLRGAAHPALARLKLGREFADDAPCLPKRRRPVEATDGLYPKRGCVTKDTTVFVYDYERVHTDKRLNQNSTFES